MKFLLFIIIIIILKLQYLDNLYYFWDFPLERDVAAQYWEEYHPVSSNVNPFPIMESNIANELANLHSDNYVAYEDCNQLYQSIYTVLDNNPPISINNLITLINLK